MNTSMDKSSVSYIAVYGVGLVVCAMFTNAFAGNTEMVEGRVGTLDKINKEAIQQIPDMPVSGRVQLEAEGTQHDDIIKIKVKRYKITPIEKRSIQLDGKTSDTVDKEKQNEG